MAEVAADKILKTLGIDKPMVAGMFLVGSHLWGTARKDSDWDVVVIMKNNFKKGKSKKYVGDETETSIHNSNVDAWVISEKKFAEAVRKHRMYELMCLYVPIENRLINYSFPIKFDIDAKILFDQTLSVYARDWEKANKQGGKNNLKRAEKILLHCTRNLLLTLQLLRNGKIEVFDEANKYVRQIWQPIPDQYKDLQFKFQTIHDELMLQINRYIKIKNSNSQK